jgi:hypothetical protein
MSGIKMTLWRKARKKPIIVEFREVEPIVGFVEAIHTEEGILWAHLGEDYIIRGVEGEIYPCKKEIFAKTYDIVKEE